MKTIPCVFAAAALTFGLATARADQPEATPKSADVLAAMRNVGIWQLANPSRKDPTCWEKGALYTGMMALGDLAPEPEYRAAMMDVGRTNSWKLGPMMYHADDHAVGQMYCEMYSLYRDQAMIASTLKRFDRILANPSPGKVQDRINEKNIRAGIMRWWWCDALFMAPPAWIRLYAATGEKKYLDFMIQEWKATSAYLYDTEEKLYFRDNSYFKKREINGKKIFWSRGNGWVMGGLVRVLQVLPSDHPDRAFFVSQFKEMAASLLKCRQPDGLWRASLLDPANYPSPEASGSGFYCYALAWGVNQGLLERDPYATAAIGSWRALNGLVQPDGKLTHVQPVGANPKTFDENHTDVYGVGAFLLAGSEIYRMALAGENAYSTLSVTSDLNAFRPQQTVEVDWKDVTSRLPGAKSDNVAVMDGVAGRWITSQVLDENGDGTPEKLLFQCDFLPRQTKEFRLIAGVDRALQPAPVLHTFARFVPERADDFAWENDRIAYRIYGPALWKMDGPKKNKPSATGSGVDVWCKHVRSPMINYMYKNDKYHTDDGKGVDSYKVGTAMGCGGTAIWAQDRLWSGRCYDSWKLVSDGPIRAIFELTYGEWEASGRKVSETKRISLDLGSNFSRFDCRFSADGADPVTGAAGATIHNTGLVENGTDWAAVWEPADSKKDGMIGTSVVMPGGEYKMAADHALFLKQIKSGDTVSFYAGAGWSKGPDFPDQAAWTAEVRACAARINSPLKTGWR